MARHANTPYSRSRMVRAGVFLGITALSIALSGCSATTQNVRAFRAYAEEEANLKVNIDRVQDIAAVLDDVDQLLTGTTYTPGDQWPKRIPLGDADFKTEKSYLADKYPYNGCDTCEVPIVKIYRDWIETELRNYAPPPEKAMYPSLLDAVAALGPRSVLLKDHYTAYRTATAQLSDATEAMQKLQNQISQLSSEGAQRAMDPQLAAARLKVEQARAQVDTGKSQLDKDAQDAISDAQLTSPQKQQIARDALSVLSVVLRIEMEVVALIPIVIIQMVRSIPNAPKDMTVKLNMKIGKQVWDLPVYLTGITEHFQRQIAAMEIMCDALARGLKTSVEDSPGFELSESIVDQIVGITLDSLRLDLNASGYAFIYSAIGTSDRSSSSDEKTTYDYRGRQYKLDYKINPIYFASARMDLTLDWIQLPGVANLGFGYSTDRVWKGGGSISNTSLENQLGITGPASDVLDAALGLLGVQSSVRVATFTTGTLNQVQATNVNNVVSSAPLQLKQTQVDVGYDILWALQDPSLHASMEQLIVGGRYLEYTLPRILYELQDTSRVAGEQHFSFIDPQTGQQVGRESPPQPVTSGFYMLGATGRFGQGEAPRWSPYLDVGIYGGAGPTSFYFLKDPTQPNTLANRDDITSVAFAFDGHAGLGLRWRVFPRATIVRLEIRALYQGDFLYETISRSATPNGRAVTTDFGQFDIYHGPTFAIKGSL
jgi:hypothetical protein